MKLIALKGRMHSGKDTALQFIREAAAPASVQRAAFMDQMKLSGVRALGFDITDVNEAVRIADIIKEKCDVMVALAGTSAPVTVLTVGATTPHCCGENDTLQFPPPPKPARISGREFWQRYGTEAHREVFGHEFWVNVLLPEPSMHPVRDNREWDNADALRRRFPGVDVLIITDCRMPMEARRVRALGGQVWAIDADLRLGPLPEDAHVSEYPLPPELVTVTVPNNGAIDQFEFSIKTTWDLCRGK